MSFAFFQFFDAHIRARHPQRDKKVLPDVIFPALAGQLLSYVPLRREHEIVVLPSLPYAIGRLHVLYTLY